MKKTENKTAEATDFEINLEEVGDKITGGANVIVKEGETLDNALRRFKRSCTKEGVIHEIRKRESYVNPSVKRKKKSEAARKRKYI